MKDVKEVSSKDRQFLQIVEEKMKRLVNIMLCLFLSETRVRKCQTTEEKLWRDWCIWRIGSRERYHISLTKRSSLMTWSQKAAQERKIQDCLERFGLSHTMACITQASLGKSEWSLIAAQSLMNDHWIKNC